MNKKSGSMVEMDNIQTVYENEMEIIFDAKSENEKFARVVAAAFCTRLDPTIEQITDVKTAVSEAVTNCIVHGYDNCKTSDKKK